MKPNLRIYTASCLHHAPLWRQLAHEWNEFTFSARWPFHHCDSNGTPIWPESFAPIFWEQDVEDIKNSDVLLIWAEPTDPLRGALVEAGVALGLGKKIILSGQNERFGTWQFHPLISSVKSLEEGRKLLNLLAI